MQALQPQAWPASVAWRLRLPELELQRQEEPARCSASFLLSAVAATAYVGWIPALAGRGAGADMLWSSGSGHCSNGPRRRRAQPAEPMPADSTHDTTTHASCCCTAASPLAAASSTTITAASFLVSATAHGERDSCRPCATHFDDLVRHRGVWSLSCSCRRQAAASARTPIGSALTALDMYSFSTAID